MQGLGKPGINMGNLQWGSPVDLNFYFPGYADGGMSGDIEKTAMAVELFQRMPQLPTVNTPNQRIPRIFLPEAILEGKTDGGYPWSGKSIETQFAKFSYPAPGHAPVRMMFAEPRIRRQPGHLVRGRHQIRRRYPARLYKFRTDGHQRMGWSRRLRPPWPAAAQSSRHHLPGAGDRAAWRVKIRLLDFHRNLQTTRPGKLLQRGRQRNRLG
jgi:hypothetical protein